MSNEVNKIQFGEFTLDIPARHFARGDVPIPLSAKVFDLLVYMAENPQRPLLKKELLTALWPDSFVEESNLSQNIFILRKAMGDAGGGTILTLPSRGYQFTAEVRKVAEAASPVAVQEFQVATLERTRTQIIYEEEDEEHVPFWRSPIPLALAVAAVVALAAAGWLGWERYEDRTGGPPVQVVMTGFDGTTGDAALDQALSTELRADLAQSPYVTLVPTAVVRKTLTLMTLSADAELTPTIAHDVCERTGSQAVLRETVAAAGAHYLLTGEAVGCVDGATIATVTQTARSRDELPDSVDRLGKGLRLAVGESRRTIARFSQPLIGSHTGSGDIQSASIEALEDWSRAGTLSQTGKFNEAIELLKQAVTIDPHFAVGWFDMSSYAGNANDYKTAREYLKHAYAEREHATASTRFMIEGRYESEVMGDFRGSERIYQAMLALYPRSATAMSALAESERQLGHHAEAAAILSRALTLQPSYTTLYYGVCSEQMKSGKIDEARKSCEDGIRHGLDGEAIRATLMKVASLQHDSALLAEQIAWGEEHHSSLVEVQQIEIATSEGRAADARLHLARACALLQQKPSDPLCGSYHMGVAADLAELGEVAQGQALLTQVIPDPADRNGPLAFAETGDLRVASEMLATQTASQPTPGAWNDNYGALTRAAILLQQNKPGDVPDILEPARMYEGTNLATIYFRGIAYQRTGRYALAEAEFTRLLAEPWIDADCVELPLAQVALAESLAAEGKRDEALQAYAVFFKEWAHADPPMKLLQRARDGERQLQSAK